MGEWKLDPRWVNRRMVCEKTVALIVCVIVKSSGFRAKVMDESERVLRWAAQQAREKGCSSRLTVCRASIAPIAEPDGSFDLVLVRGAFFFLTSPLLREIK